MLAYGGVAMSERNLGTDQAAHTLHAGLWVVVMSKGAPAHTLYHSSEDAFLYMTHMGPPTRSQSPLINTETKVIFLLSCQIIFQVGREEAGRDTRKRIHSRQARLGAPIISHIDFSYFKEVIGVKGHHLDVMMNISHLLLRENLFFDISLKITCGSSMTGSDGPDLPRHRNTTFKE